MGRFRRSAETSLTPTGLSQGCGDPSSQRRHTRTGPNGTSSNSSGLPFPVISKPGSATVPSKAGSMITSVWLNTCHNP
ncbi:hypothetical protein P280DRAFT_72 [Massarina eburnea CBS 473.64]|uniref:Uncharacterized protein n=1 Tax=Massarina eburnea CBS 473.64 TaxID=1395130 RepID=A0A6A6SE07_9PLEO|nr:hypothetical protein P280DRAFT_72 [Massarina eburnea CBS 473.64]